jgi:hypothetical protein
VSEETGFNIKKFMERAVWTPTWISNGHFAVRKLLVKLGKHLTSDDAIICAFPSAKVVVGWDDEKMTTTLGAVDGVRVEFTRSPWCHRNAALFLDANGNAAWFNADYCDALKIGALFGPSQMFAKPGDKEVSVPWCDQPTFEEATIVIMPMRVPVDWDQVARTVAAATSLEEATAEQFADMPAESETSPEDEGDSAETVTDAPQLDLSGGQPA